MLDWVAGAVQSAKTMKEIGQSLLTIRDENIIRERVYALNNNLMDLQQKLLEAQLSQMELVQRIQALEDERDQANQSTSVKSQYQIHTFETSHHAYVLKTDDQEKPTHFYCSHCMETESLPMTLQGSAVLSCPKCKYTVRSAPYKPTRLARR
ncbi:MULTISPECIES: hypothetical protein [Pseudomonas]|uniref:C4-type zinc ribbon domain-containing protein n=1 Tax=Pseudomonas putida S13.1.2 TaxID=1384061 RepID=A0AAU8S8B1_PSEPU|nr:MULTISPECIES: hypothetical protein [Pseudomonas]AJQ47941.1 hypothetical protein N805_12255 [Pseudomonas putida S13.1.2]